MRRITRLVVLTVVAALAMLCHSTSALAQPSNDDISGPVIINGLPFTATANTSDATVAADDPATTCFGPAATVWYRFTPSQSGPVALSTEGSDYDTTLAVFTGSPGALNEVACNDDRIGLAAALIFSGDAGTTCSRRPIGSAAGPRSSCSGRRRCCCRAAPVITRRC